MNKVTEKTHRVLRVMGEVIGEGTTSWTPRRGLGGGGWEEGAGKGGGQVETEGSDWGGAG